MLTVVDNIRRCSYLLLYLCVFMCFVAQFPGGNLPRGGGSCRAPLARLFLVHRVLCAYVLLGNRKPFCLASPDLDVVWNTRRNV